MFIKSLMLVSLTFLFNAPLLAEPFIHSDGVKSSVRLSPKIRYERKSYIDKIAPFLQPYYIVIDAEQKKNAPYLLGLATGGLLIQEDDQLYVKGLLTKGEHYGIYQMGTTYRDPLTDEELGDEAVLVGMAQALAKQDHQYTQVVITKALREIKAGDKLLPLATLDHSIKPLAKGSAAIIPAGYIIGLPNGRQGSGKFDVVVINRGARDKLKEGSILAIERPVVALTSAHGKTTLSTLPPSKNVTSYPAKQVTALPEVVGKLMVFRVYDKFSYGLILDNQDIVRIGYQVTNL